MSARKSAAAPTQGQASNNDRARPLLPNVAQLLREDLWYGSETETEKKAEADAAKSIAAQVGRILGAKPFPLAASKLADLTRDTRTPLTKVVDVLETDPALSARLLRLVNSAGYALRTACTSVGHAAALVGTNKLHQVATTAAILDMYDTSTPAAAEVLEHATIVGALCRYLAVLLGLPPDDLFTCGFLHDIGKLMLLDCEGAPYLDVLSAGGNQPDVVHIKERELYGYDHALLAGHVLAAWNIPDPVPKVVAWHHQATRAYDDPLIARMVAVVRLCDAISYAVFRPLGDPEIERLSRTEAASYLEISEAQMAAMWEDLRALAIKARAGFRGEEVPEAVLARTRLAHLAADSPANDNQLPAAADPTKTPRHFPCVVCGVPSYANQCPACHGYVCPGHQLGEEEWCYLCLDEYRALELRFPRWVYGSVISLTCITIIASLVGASTAASGSTLQLIAAPGLAGLCLTVLLVVWHRWLRRFWFLRTVADRTGHAPVVTEDIADGFTTLPPSSKRVINPFDKTSLAPGGISLSPGREYYSLPPVGSRAAAIARGEVIALGEADSLDAVELNDDGPLLDLDETFEDSDSVAAVREHAVQPTPNDKRPAQAEGSSAMVPLDPFADDDDFFERDLAPASPVPAAADAATALAEPALEDPFDSADQVLGDDDSSEAQSDAEVDDPFASLEPSRLPATALATSEPQFDDPFAEDEFIDSSDDPFADSVPLRTQTTPFSGAVEPGDLVAEDTASGLTDDPFADPEPSLAAPESEPTKGRAASTPLSRPPEASFTEAEDPFFDANTEAEDPFSDANTEAEDPFSDASEGDFADSSAGSASVAAAPPADRPDNAAADPFADLDAEKSFGPATSDGDDLFGDVDVPAPRASLFEEQAANATASQVAIDEDGTAGSDDELFSDAGDRSGGRPDTDGASPESASFEEEPPAPAKSNKVGTNGKSQKLQRKVRSKKPDSATRLNADDEPDSTKRRRRKTKSAQPLPNDESSLSANQPGKPTVAKDGDETDGIAATYTFRHPRAWRTVAEPAGPADGW